MIFFVLASGFSVVAQTFTSVQTGDWDDTDTWGTTGITDDYPAFGDEVTITSNHVISINALAQAGAVSIEGSASITLNNTLIVSNLEMSGTSSISGSGSLSSFGNFSIPSGTVSINGGSISSTGISLGSASLTIGAASLNVTGNTSISGTITFTSSTGTKEFRNVIVNAGGTWNNTSTESFTTRNITNNGTWNGCGNTTDCSYTISGTRIISGANEISIPILIVNGTVSNTAVLEITNQLSGTGTLRNGSAAISGTLEFNGDGPFTIATPDFSTFMNTVAYTDAGSVTAIATTYRNLTINKSANEVSLGGQTTVSNSLTLSSGNLVLGAHNLILAEAASPTDASSASFIQDTGAGVVRREVSATGIPLYVPIGGNNFSPITLTLNEATFGASPSVDFSISDSAHPQRDRDNRGDSPAGDDDGTVSTDYLDVYWTVAGNDISSPVFTAEYTYDASDFSQTTESNLVPALYRSVGGTLDWLAVGSVNATNNKVSMDSGDGFGDLYAMDNTLERLPVHLISFAGKPSKKSVVLNWVTASEENNNYFEVERSLDGISFEKIGEVTGVGNSSSIQNYRFIDRFPLSGRLYYRLRQVDFNGTFEYSEVISVTFEGLESALHLSIFPNPVQTNRMVSIGLNADAIGQPFILKVLSLNGEELINRSLESNTDLELDLSSFKPGLYLVHALFNGERLSKKLLIN